MVTSALDSISAPRLGTFVAAIIVGLSIGTLASPEPVAVPAVGTVSGLLVGGVGLAVGGGLYLAIRRSTDGCGCGGSCGC